MNELLTNPAAPMLPADLGRNPSQVVCAANEARFTAAHYSEPLTAFTVGWRDPENLQTLLDFLAPPVPAGRRFEFKRHDNAEAFYSEADDVRALGAPFKRVEYTGDSVLGKTLNKGLTIRVDHDEAVGDDWQERYVQLLLTRLLRNEVRRAFAAIQAGANVDTKTWPENGDVANPDADLRAALMAAADDSGVRPNRVLFGEGAWALRGACYDAQNNAGARRSADLTPDDLARKLFVDGVRVAAARYQTSPSAKAAIVGNQVFCFYAEPLPGKDEPANLKRFYTPTDSGGPFRVFLEDHAKYTDISVEHYSTVIVTSELGLNGLTVSAT
ncbi:MAG TPA: hypothetical protein VHC95_06330 [Opitutales bacterium]|nr:hypothetical protein [Opitutales bacterium]